MPDRIQIRRDTTTNWVSANPTLAPGELSFANDTNLLKIGNGGDPWTALPRVNPSINSIVSGRLSIFQNVAVPLPEAGNVNSPLGTILYYVPYTGNKIALYGNGSWESCRSDGWQIYTFDNATSISLAGLPSDTNYDVFAYPVNDAVNYPPVAGGVGVVSGNQPINGSVRLSLAPWSDSWTRGTSIVAVDGVLVKDGDIRSRYLGTIRTSTNGATEFTRCRKFVFNYYNRVTFSSYAYQNTLHQYIYPYFRPYDLFNNWDAPGNAGSGYEGRLSFVSGVPLSYRFSYHAGVTNGYLAPAVFMASNMKSDSAVYNQTAAWSPYASYDGVAYGQPTVTNTPTMITTLSASTNVTPTNNPSGLAQFWLAERGIGADSTFYFANINVEVMM